jgi:hypothetical protein
MRFIVLHGENVEESFAGHGVDTVLVGESPIELLPKAIDVIVDP